MNKTEKTFEVEMEDERKMRDMKARILELLKEKGELFSDEIIVRLGEEDLVRRSLYWLGQQGLTTATPRYPPGGLRIGYSLTEAGKKEVK